MNIGFLKVKACCGKILPMKVRPTANAQCILEKGVTKDANHYKEVHEGLEYVLRYLITVKQLIYQAQPMNVSWRSTERMQGKPTIVLPFSELPEVTLMAELPTLDDDIEIDLDDDIDLKTSVFTKMELSTVHEKARPSDEMKTCVAQNGASFFDAGTSEDKATNSY